MENGGASTKGVLIPVPESSEAFQSSILAPLQSAYLYEESKYFFRYNSAVLVENPELEEKYEAFRAKRKSAGYTDYELKESFGFLLFEDSSKANALGETGLSTGNSKCSTLGDPLKGVYISMYSDCLDLNRWYHGKSGYIAIVRLTKGKVKRVVENYTQNFTEPTVGFDCHVSEQLPLVSDKTSSFLAFERTQYYIYELLDDGSNGTTPSPSAAYPIAVVSFSYMDTKAAVISQEKSEMTELVYKYLLWRGQFQINHQFYNVDLRSTAVDVIPVKLPPVVKVDKVISMSVLRQVLPKAVFETCYAEEVHQDGFYCSLCEFVPPEGKEETSSFAQLLLEIKEKDVALTVPLCDGGFLILLHSSHFLTYDDTESISAEALHGLFVFPHSRAVRRDTKFERRKFAMPSEILRLLPVLSYAEGEVEKTPLIPSNDLSEVLAQHIQSYATLINPCLSTSPSMPSRELSIFPDQYDVSEAHQHLYSSPECSNRTWQSIKSYLSKPASFQLPVSKISEILAAEQEEQREYFNDDVYICLSPPEEAPASPVGMDLENQFSDQQSLLNDEMSVRMSNVECEVSPISMPQSIVVDNFQAEHAVEDNQNCTNITELNKTDDTKVKRSLAPHTSEDLPEELIVSITSAEQRITNETLSSVGAKSTERGDFQFSGFSPIAKLQVAEENSVSDETDTTKKLLHASVVTKLIGRKPGKLSRKLSQAQKRVSKPCVETQCLQTAISAVEVDNLNFNTNGNTKEVDFPQLNNSLKTSWRKLQRRKRRFGKLSSKNKKVRSGTVGSAKAEKNSSENGQQSLENTILMELDSCHLRKKTERWDLKPVISECRRILVPFGSVDIDDQIRTLKVELQSSKNECLENISADVPVTVPATVETEKESSIMSLTEVSETVATQSTDSVDDLQSISHVTSEQSTLKKPVDDSDSVPSTPDLNISSSKSNGTVLNAVQSNQTETLSPVKRFAKGEYLLSQLKSVLLRRKRKLDIDNKEKVENPCQEDEPGLKKTNVDSNTETSKCNNTSTLNAKSSVSDVSKMLSVDPVFAYYLGLSPKESQDKGQTTEDQDARQSKDPTENEKPASLDKQPQIMQRTFSIFPKRKNRMKTLKMHQGVSAENVKKKWWLHFQTPASYTSEKVTENDCSRDNTVRKTVEEKMKSACSSADALNLLADLALSVSYDQVPPQPNEALDKNPKESLKKSDLERGFSSADQESVLHALLKTSAAKAIQPLKSSSSPPLIDSELIDLMSKEHNYSLPPSSSLLLDLPGTTFQVPPLSGTTGLLNHHQTVHGNGVKTLHQSVIHDDTSEHSRTSEYLHRNKQKFKHTRTFVIKDGSIEVTRKWEENYDFNLDSRFTSDPKNRGIIRALHGPWDCLIQNTAEGMQLIYHMWIGLFYSRSTARFFQLDPSLTHQCPEESKPVENATEMVSGPARPENNTNSSATLSSVTTTPDSLVSEALNPSTKESSLLEPESEVLDLSLRNTVAKPVSSELQLQVNKKESSEQMEPPEMLNGQMSPVKIKEKETFKSCKKMTEIISEVIDVSNSKNGEMEITPKAFCSDHSEMSSLKVEGTCFTQQEEMKSVSFEANTVQVALGTEHVLHECNKVNTYVNDHSKNPETTAKSFDQRVEVDSLTSETDKKVDSILEENVDKHEKPEETCNKTNDSCPEGNIDPRHDVMHTDDESANKESDIICSEDDLANGKMWSRVESKDVLPIQNDNLNGKVDCCERRQEFKDNDYLRASELDEKESCISTTETDRDLRNQLTPKMCDVPMKEVCVSESIQAQMHEQLPLADSTEDVCYNLCANPTNLKYGNPILNSCSTSADITNISKDSLAEENFETNKEICLNPALPFFDDGTCLLDDSSIPKLKDNIETEDKIKEFNFHLCMNDHKEQEIKLAEREDSMGKTTPQEQIQLQSLSPSSTCEVVNMCELDKSLTEKMGSTANETIGEMDKKFDGIAIPGFETNSHGIHVVLPQDEVEKAVQGQEAIPFLNETPGPVEFPIEVCSPSQICDENAELSHKTPILDASKMHKSEVLQCVLDSRAPTPTMDEKPYEDVSSSSLGSSSFAYSNNEICQNITEKCSSRSSIPVIEELPMKQKGQTSTANTDPNHLHNLGPDVKLRTLRVLQSIDEYLSTAYHVGVPTQIDTADKKTPEPPKISSQKSVLTCLGPSHISVDLTNERTSYEKPPEISNTSSQDLAPKPTDDTLASPFTNNLQEVLDVKLQPRNKKSSIHSRQFKSSNRHNPSVLSDMHSSRSCAASVGLRGKHKPTLQSSLKRESCSQSQRPVMAVKPSKNEESRAHWFAEDTDVKTTSHNKRAVAHTIKNSVKNLIPSKNTTKGNFKRLKHNNTCELSSKTSLLANTSCNTNKANEVKSVLDLQHWCKERNTSEFTVQSFDSTESYPKYVDGCQGSFKYSLRDTIEHTTKQTSYHKDNLSKDEHIPETPGVLVCTVFNTGQNNSYSFLDQLSRRCLSDDLTKASVEQESLIFSEQMKNLLKKSKGGPISQQDTCDSSTQACTSPLTVNFSNLDLDSLEVLDMPLVLQKISVDMSDRKGQTNPRKEEKKKFSHSQRTNNPAEHAGVSGMVAEYTKVYEAKMHNVCSIKKTCRPKRIHQGYSGTEASNHFDFCDQMKKELDKSFRCNLNAVVKRSCKTKYRFYILVMSDAVFFDKTKAYMEAEGHTAVQPSEFFHDEGGSSCLLIILRNEDIAEHICKVPHLLKLKMTPDVQFAGIDEPDDVVNFTHQELFTRAGFIMFDKALLEPLSLCYMKKISESLQVLSRKGKWKWMLHYRDSRRLKENARLSQEANEKKLFLCWGQDAGILEVLPYHECDSASKDQPDYLTCLLRLQVQHISSRYPVFITDETTESAFEKNGILTMTLDAFLTKSPTEKFTI